MIVIRYKFRLIIIFCLLTSSLSCDDAEKQKLDNNKIVVVLLDLSIDLTKSGSQYLSNFRKVLNNLKEGDRLVCCYITDNSISQSDLLINYNFEYFRPTTDNSMLLKVESDNFYKQLDQTKDSLEERVNILIKSPIKMSPKTDIISAIHLASDIFKNYPLYNSRNLIIQSDMMEYSEAHNFYKEIFTENNIKKIMDYEITKRSLPNLDSVKIFVCGASAEPNNQFFDVKRFWFEYFRKCKADFHDENYAGMLIHFE